MSGFDDAPTGAFRFEPLGREPFEPVDAALETDGDALIAVAALPSHTAWRVRAGIGDAWAADVTVKAGKAGTTTAVAVPIWPAGMISGRFVLADRRGAMPTTLALDLSPARDEGSLHKALGQASACPIRDDGQWRCRIPAGRFDVVVRPAGFVPLYRWDLDIVRANDVKLGTMTLEKGASVQGYIETTTGLVLPARTRVRAEPLAAPGGPTPGERLSKAASEARVDHNGFFQLTGVRRGTVRLVVESEGYATSSVFPLEILEGAETALREPIVLDLPLTVDLRVNPPTAPDGGPWVVRATRSSDYSASYNHEAAFEGPVDDVGRILALDQAPGRYLIEIMDQRGQSWATLFDHPVEGVGDVLVAVAIDLVVLSGIVTLGEEPVAGKVFFGGRYGEQSVMLVADEDGTFEGVIPRDGIWLVEVKSADGALDAKTHVELSANRDGVAEVEIALPDTHVFGVVVDSEGRPVQHAQVSIISREGGDTRDTDHEGRYSFRSHVGRIGLSAKHVEQVAEPALLDLADGVELGPITLRLGEMRAITGSVVGANGPVAGAYVSATTVLPSRASGGEARTGLDGAFEFSVPHSASALEILVAAPGHALEAFVMDARGASLDIVVSPSGGSVILRTETDPTLYGLALLFQNNVHIMSQTLYMWALGNGGSISSDGALIEAHNLAPGSYRYCLGERTVLYDVNAWQAASTCTSGRLSPGGTLELVLDGDRAEAQAP